MVLNLVIFSIICLLLIHFGYQWIQNVLSTHRKSRDLVNSQTDKYKQLLDQIILEKAQGGQKEFVEPTKMEVDLEQDLLVFSHKLLNE